MGPCPRPISIILTFVVLLMLIDGFKSMSVKEKRDLKLKVLEMFNHGYRAYMDNAYPADELMPLSCKGRYRGTEPSRGDVDDTLGNFTLTLIDTLDTLAVLGHIEEFENAVKLILRDSVFDSDIIVSVFETNIRILGGLLGGHVMASFFKKKRKVMMWYNDELLDKAKDIGYRLLPAFNTSTGIPYPRINLLHGIQKEISDRDRDTCTACAGTMLLEFAALSRLTGEPLFEEKARKAMDFLWQQRHRQSDLVGTVINIHNGDWVRRDSGIGAGIDSYYEYVLKGYILLGDDSYLDRFNKHYDAIMKYISQGPLLLDVHMHKPQSTARQFMDALLAFWPGLQVLKGDIRPAIETHEMLFQVMQRHNFIPEAFTSDYRVHWGHHPLRPEFVESTYFLYKATGDPHYLDVGKAIMENLEKHARVPCGFAAIRDVTRGTHENQMDSFVLAETFKYLYLLFAEKESLVFDVDDYIFTTEAHLLPLSLSVYNISQSSQKIRPDAYKYRKWDDPDNEKSESYDTCPNTKYLFPGDTNYAHQLRVQMRNLINKASPRPHVNKVQGRLRAIDFIAGNIEQLEHLHRMGIRIATMSDGRIQLLHTASEAATPVDADDGMRFMQEMIELSKTQPNEPQHEPMSVQLISHPFFGSVSYTAGPAQFGYDLKQKPSVKGKVAIAKPYRVCSPIENEEELVGKIAILERGDCMFIDKARYLQKVGAIGGIVLDHKEATTSAVSTLFAMSGDGSDDVSIPMVFLFSKEGKHLISSLTKDLEILLTYAGKSDVVTTDLKPPEPVVDFQEPPQKSLNPEPVSSLTEDGPGHYQMNVGSTNTQIKVKISTKRASPMEPDVQDGDVINLLVLPNGSKQLSFRFDHLVVAGDGKEKPELNQIYVDLVLMLQERTNFVQLKLQSDYLLAIARMLESAYFGLQDVDKQTQSMLERLAQELIIYPKDDKNPEESEEEMDENEEVLTNEEILVNEEGNLEEDPISEEEMRLLIELEETHNSDEVIYSNNDIDDADDGSVLRHSESQQHYVSAEDLEERTTQRGVRTKGQATSNTEPKSPHSGDKVIDSVQEANEDYGYLSTDEETEFELNEEYDEDEEDVNNDSGNENDESDDGDDDFRDNILIENRPGSRNSLISSQKKINIDGNSQKVKEEL